MDIGQIGLIEGFRDGPVQRVSADGTRRPDGLRPSVVLEQQCSITRAGQEATHESY